MQATRRRDTPGELALRTALRALGLRYRIEVMLPGTRRRADVAFVRAKVAVFVDGCFWHGCPEHGRVPSTNPQYWPAKFARNRARDERVTAALEADGWTVVRLWEHVPVAEAAERVRVAVAAGLEISGVFKP